MGSRYDKHHNKYQFSFITDKEIDDLVRRGYLEIIANKDPTKTLFRLTDKGKQAGEYLCRVEGGQRC